MVKITVEVVEKHGLKELRERFEDPAEFDFAYKTIGQLVREFFYKRFKKFQKGGGDWPPLKRPRRKLRGRKTKSGRRDRRFKKRDDSKILSVTNTLLNAFLPKFQNNPGQWEQRTKDGIETGLGGPGQHPDYNGTVAELGFFHHTGAGHLPIREVAESLSEEYVKKIEDAVVNQVDEIIQKTTPN